MTNVPEPLLTIYLDQGQNLSWNPKEAPISRLRSVPIAELPGGVIPDIGDAVLLPRRKTPLTVHYRQIDFRDGMIGWRVFVHDPWKKS